MDNGRRKDAPDDQIAVHDGSESVDSVWIRPADACAEADAGKRTVIFSGGPAKGTDAVLEELRQLAKGGANGTIMGRNAFQREADCMGR